MRCVLHGSNRVLNARPLLRLENWPKPPHRQQRGAHLRELRYRVAAKVEERRVQPRPGISNTVEGGGPSF